MRKSQAIQRGFTTMNRVELVRGGKPYFDTLLKLISEAEQVIHLNTYIFDNDETGMAVAQALMEAASRKVRVYLMLDGYASQSLSKKLVAEMKAAGIRFRFFAPLFKGRNFYFGRRMHHKIFVADSRFALTGGINISNRYNDTPGERAWLDFAVLVEGDIAHELCMVCWKTWNGFIKKRGRPPCAPGQTFQFKNSESSLVRLRRNDWVRRKNQISVTYVEMFRNARSHITIVCSYFLPGRLIRHALAAAVKRGVAITVITAGKSDVMMAKRAERWMYDWLLRKKIRVYEFQPAVLHSKIAVCDGEWLTIGSYNINNLSAYASIELNLDIRNKAFTEKTEEQLQEIIDTECIEITQESHKKNKNPFRQFKWWMSYHLIRFMLYLFTFYFKKENIKTRGNKVQSPAGSASGSTASKVA